ncbi:uncharacterized protein LOC122086285 isoform X1 [Macadamia integrifolia]|uniref:uncharacterized protein LOC122086285 isoform X1 n=1 Tax=Macadamia integrifolia TaxID=60698 RepID=UPI001C4F2864|nr:uncharacterized protein LOC122086285 isoform X1 [Macadamia integrifolia]
MADVVTRKKEAVEDGEAREGKSSEEEVKKVGFINHLISTLPASLVIPLSPRSRQVDEEQEVISDSTSQVKEVESTNNDGDDDGGGGIINSLISNFFHPREGGGGEEEPKDKKDEKVEAEASEAKVEGSGGLIDNLVSHLPSSLPVGIFVQMMQFLQLMRQPF